MMRKAWFSTLLLLLVCAVAGTAMEARAQDADSPTAAEDESGVNERRIAAEAAVRRLTSRDPLERQRAAEELARLVATEQRTMIEGYRTQERNARARLALDWAAYRLGRADLLFNIVRALDSARANQATEYLAQLESPAPLYLFLDRGNKRTRIKLLEALARIGDEATLAKINPYLYSADPQIADAARFAAREITLRMNQPAAPQTARPRQVGDDTDATPLRIRQK